MATTINATTTGLVETSDGTAILDLQTGGTTALRVNASQAIGVGSSPSFGTAGQFLTSQGNAASPTWTSGGTGTVTSVSWTGGIVSVATATTTPAFTITGTSGGIPYFSGTNTWASSAALTANGVVYGGGAGVAPAATAAGTTGQFLGANTGGAPTWQTPTIGAAGSNTQVQFNDGGTNLGGDSGLTYDKTTDNLTIAGNLVISTSGKGIDFSATPGTGTSELLADYEEGTWTPVLSDGTNNATMTGGNVGRYVKVGSQVTIFAFVTTSSLGSVSGNLRITGIPFNAGSNMYAGVAAGYGQNLIIVADQSVCCYIGPSSAFIDLRIWNATTGTSQLQGTNWTGSNGGIIFSMTYNT